MRRAMIGLVLLGLAGCSQSFWDRSPRVAGSYQQRPDTTTSAPCQAPVSPRTSCAPAPCPPTPCPPAAVAPPTAPPVCGANDLPTTIAAGPNLDEQKVYVEVNRIRRARGLRPLAWNERLRLAAAEHSHEQYRHGYMGHGSPDPNRRTLIQRIRLTGYDGRCFGEVVAWGYKTPEAVVEGWMNSPDHRAILVDRDLSEVGFSRVGDYWTGNFGAPRTPRPVATYAPVRRPPVAAAPAPRRRPEPSYAYAAPAPTSAPAPPVRSYFQPPRPTPTPAPARRVPARSG